MARLSSLMADINVFVGCCLGGTSLVNANVALRWEPRIVGISAERVQAPRAVRVVLVHRLTFDPRGVRAC